MFFLSVFVESIGNEGIFISQVTTQKKQENTRSIRLFAESTLLVFLSLSLSVAPVKLHFTLKKKQYNKKKNIKTENEHERKKTWKMESRGLSREKMLMYLLFYIKENSVMQTRGAILLFFFFFAQNIKWSHKHRNLEYLLSKIRASMKLMILTLFFRTKEPLSKVYVIMYDQ